MRYFLPIWMHTFVKMSLNLFISLCQIMLQIWISFYFPLLIHKRNEAWRWYNLFVRSLKESESSPNALIHVLISLQFYVYFEIYIKSYLQDVYLSKTFFVKLPYKLQKYRHSRILWFSVVNQNITFRFICNFLSQDL